MAAAVIQEPEAPEAARITQVEDLPEPVRADIVARRQNGETLAELKTRFTHIDPAVIREVLPPANARERQQREAKSKVTETKQGVGGRSGEAKSEPKAKQAEPKPAPEPRYAADLGDLPERVAAARKVMGRKDLSAALGISESATWRAEQGRVHPGEVKPLTDALVAVEQRIAAGEFKKEERQPKAATPSKADLTHRVETVVEFIETVRSDKNVAKSALADGVLAILDPTDAPKA
jgi:hypothetical protein